MEKGTLMKGLNAIVSQVSRERDEYRLKRERKDYLRDSTARLGTWTQAERRANTVMLAHFEDALNTIRSQFGETITDVTIRHPDWSIRDCSHRAINAISESSGDISDAVRNMLVAAPTERTGGDGDNFDTQVREDFIAYAVNVFISALVLEARTGHGMEQTLTRRLRSTVRDLLQNDPNERALAYAKTSLSMMRQMTLMDLKDGTTQEKALLASERQPGWCHGIAKELRQHPCASVMADRIATMQSSRRGVQPAVICHDMEGDESAQSAINDRLVAHGLDLQVRPEYLSFIRRSVLGELFLMTYRYNLTGAYEK